MTPEQIAAEEAARIPPNLGMALDWQEGQPNPYSGYSVEELSSFLSSGQVSPNQTPLAYKLLSEAIQGAQGGEGATQIYSDDSLVAGQKAAEEAAAAKAGLSPEALDFLKQFYGITTKATQAEAEKEKLKLTAEQEAQLAELKRLQELRDSAYSKTQGEWAPGDFKASELYKFQQQQLQQALDRQMRAAGMSGSGMAAKASAEQQRALGAEETERFMGRLYGLAGMGAAPASAAAGAGMNAAGGMGTILGYGAQNLGNIYTGMGAAQAGGLMASGAMQGAKYSNLADIGGSMFSNYLKNRAIGNSGTFAGTTILPTGTPGSSMDYYYKNIAGIR